MTKKLKNIKFLAVFVLLSILINCLIFSIPSITARAYSGIEINTEYSIDNEILKYYHEPMLEENFEDNVVNVILKSGYSGRIGFDDFKVANSISEVIAITYKLKTINKSSNEKFSVAEDENPIFTLKLSTNDKVKVLEVVKQLQKLDMVLVAEPNYIYETESDWTPNDTLYGVQWGLDNSFGISAEQAWDITTGNNTVNVGIFENGADLNHEDLIGHIFSGNYTGSSTDDHGTHVAGIIGATHNSDGIAGVAQAEMFILARSSFVDSLIYAAQNDIKIINASFHYTVSGTDDYAPYNATHYAAIKNYDGLLICAAGNKDLDIDLTPMYPACYALPNVVSVGALTINNTRPSVSDWGHNSKGDPQGSNYSSNGTNVHIYAPGDNILSTYPMDLCIAGTCDTHSHHADGYHFKSGTSMAAPHVTGVAALLLSKHPNLTAAELKQAILDNADDINISLPDGTSQNVKKLNAYKALASLEKESYTVTLHHSDEYADYTDKVSVAYGQMMPTSVLAYAPKRAGYEFVGYFSEENGNGTQYYSMVIKTGPHHEWDYYYYEGLNPVRTWDHFSDGDLYAHWKLLECDYTYENVILNEGYLEPSTVHLKHGVNTITAKSFDGYSFSYFYNFGGYKKYTDSKVEWDIALIRDESTGDVIPKYGFYAAYEKNCIAEGTLITLANGEQVPVEQLTGDEALLVWNLFTGTFDTAPILCIDSDPPAMYQVINLYFSDGTQVKVISEHAFWDMDLNKYVYLDKDASEYIGHWYNKQTVSENGELCRTSVQLTNVIIQEEYTAAYSPVTYGHLCYYVDGMLSMPGGISGLFNIFEVDPDTMSYDGEAMQKDIERYGLFTYEEFAEILPVSQEMFEAVDGQYLKVAIGKGMIDLDGIASYINKYSALFN